MHGFVGFDRSLRMAAPVLSVRDLKVGFPTRRGTLVAVDGVSFDIAAGEVLGVVGESGAGKSLTGAAVIGLIEPPGRILGGTVHLAVGRSYPETGGTNVSAIHWDMICDLRQGGSLTADGVPVVVDGAVVQSD